MIQGMDLQKAKVENTMLFIEQGSCRLGNTLVVKPLNLGEGTGFEFQILEGGTQVFGSGKTKEKLHTKLAKMKMHSI